MFLVPPRVRAAVGDLLVVSKSSLLGRVVPLPGEYLLARQQLSSPLRPFDLSTLLIRPRVASMYLCSSGLISMIVRLSMPLELSTLTLMSFSSEVATSSGRKSV